MWQSLKFKDCWDLSMLVSTDLDMWPFDF